MKYSFASNAKTTSLTNHCNVSGTVERCVDPTSASVIFGDGIVMLISMAILSDTISVEGGRVRPSRPLKSRLVDSHMPPMNFLSVSKVLGSDSRFNEQTCGAKLTSKGRSCECCKGDYLGIVGFDG